MNRDIEFLFEIGTMRHVMRTWSQFGGLPMANLAEHTLRVAWVAMVIAKYEHADMAKVMQMALIHDIPETRTGDVNYLSRMYVKRDELKAIQDILEKTSIISEVKSLWDEYEEQSTLEAKIVKDADNLDCDFELVEMASNGADLKDTLQFARDRAYENLNTDTAKKLFKTVYAADPHSWHVNGCNRVTEGDWRKI